jgi:translation elongation factor TU
MFTPEIPIVVIGHKDHGKSTLIGRLILDTGSVKKSRYKEVRQVDLAWGRKFELAHLLDSFKEERERGMTIETTRVILKGEKRNYQLIDVPGHAELISNMLTGAAGAEAALLVVDITEGVKEQTWQHLKIARLLGIEQLGVVINKIDKVSYQKEKFDGIVRNLREILNKAGYSSKKIYFFPASALKGDNIVKKSKKTFWYQGLTLMEFLEKEVKTPSSFEGMPLIFLVQDTFNNLVLGRVESGILKKGSEVIILPDNKRTTILSLKDSEQELEMATVGQNVGIEISKKNVSRGTVLTEINSNLKVNKILSGDIFWIKEPRKKTLMFECGTAQVSGKLLKKEKNKYHISLQKPVVFQPQGKTILGKMVLKDKGEIIGVGNVR